MATDIVLSDDVSVSEAAKKILENCRVQYWYRILWRGEEFYGCSGDCEGCGMKGAMEFFIKIGEVKSAEKAKGKKN